MNTDDDNISKVSSMERDESQEFHNQKWTPDNRYSESVPFDEIVAGEGELSDEDVLLSDADTEVINNHYEIATTNLMENVKRMNTQKKKKLREIRQNSRSPNISKRHPAPLKLISHVDMDDSDEIEDDSVDLNPMAIPPWFSKYIQVQEKRRQELLENMTTQKDDLHRLHNIAKQKKSKQPVEEKTDYCQQQQDKQSLSILKHPLRHSLEQSETGNKTAHLLSESLDQECPRHKVGCTPHEYHTTLMEKDGFGLVKNSDSMPLSVKTDEATEFTKQFAQETGSLKNEGLEKRLKQIQQDIALTGTYIHTADELEFGCRLAWRNSGRCIMRKVSFALELRDCRQVASAEDCFEECVKHLKYAFNGGAIKPTISVFRPKMDGKSAPIRIWNRQLLGYAAYKRKDGTIMGDPANLGFTALCQQFGWTPPEVKSDFDVLPWLISDEYTGHDNPKIFELPPDAVEEVRITHPDFEIFQMLNLRWFALPCISNIGIDIGGIHYQTTPFNGWYQIIEIARDLLDRQRYDLTEVVAAACDIPKTTFSLWRDDAQLQVHKAILHSFAENSVSCVDHHTSSEALDYYSSEVKERGKCPGDWMWLVPPAGGSMTSVFHQEMFNFILKTRCRLQLDLWDEMGIPLPEPITVDTAKSKADSSLTFNKEACLYDRIYIYYGSETGKSLRLATMLTSEFDKDIAIGPIPLDGLPDLLVDSKVDIRALVLIVTSTFGKDNPPTAAQDFERRMKDEVAEKSVRNIDFAVLALGNSAYTESFVAFGHKVENHLQTAGCSRIMTMQVADELKNQQAGYDSFLNILMDEESGVIYVNQNRNKKDTTLDTSEDSYQQATVCFLGSTPVLHRETVEGMEDEMERQLLEKFDDSWESHTHKLGRFMDQFNFIVYPEYQDLISRLTPGDHIALYPSNMDDVVESVYRSVDVNDEDRKEARTQLKYKIDLSRPLGSSQLLELRKLLTDQPSQRIMDLTLKKSTHSNNPSMERLVQILPPGSISMHWISKYCPPIDPRFYSISSLDQKKKIVSITQSVYSFKDTGKAGTTSRWLRSLKAGDKARAIFAPTSFHLPSDKTGPLLCFSTGSGISSFRSFWLSREKRSNPMYLFYGCRKPSELPFSAEIQRLEMQGRMYPFFAYSRIKEGKMRIDELIRNERGAILKLLYNSKTTVYMCGSPDLEATIRDSLVLVLAEGDEFHPGLGTIQSMERLVVMSQANRFIREVYGKASNTDDPMTMMWQESTAKIVRSTSAMHKVGVPREPVYKKASRKMSHLNYRSSALSFRSSTLRRFANDSIFPIDDDSDYDSDDSISGELIMDGTKSGNRTYNPRISVSRL